ncbi:peptide-methionine (S)-S-oxide reductase [Clostridium sp. UBA1056]|uniref:peptide-methionine (S)-S-oxide reductase n=1 Tax=unclassified Clostridium TaxID=2614128 RepID=UPI003217F321
MIWCMVSHFDILDRILPASIFYNAEDYHQNFYKTNPIEYKKTEVYLEEMNPSKNIELMIITQYMRNNHYT